MHRGNKVYVLPGRKSFHYTDDDCPVTSSILKGKKTAIVITENEARTQGYKLCIHCRKEYQEDRRERPLNILKGIFKLFS